MNITESIDLDGLVARLTARTVKLRGTEVRVRALTADEQTEVFDRLPLTRRPPGGQVDPEMDHNNEAVWELRRALVVAAAANLCKGSLRWHRGMSAQDARDLARHVFSTLTLQEILRLHDACKDAGDPLAADPSEVIGTGTHAGN